MGLSKLISVGDKADLDETAFVEALAEDPDAGHCGLPREHRVGRGLVRTAADRGRRSPSSCLSRHQFCRCEGRLVAHGQSCRCRHRLRRRLQAVRHFCARRSSRMFDYATAFAMQPLPKGKRGRHYHQRRRTGHHRSRCRRALRLVLLRWIRQSWASWPSRSPTLRAWPVRSTCWAIPAIAMRRRWPRPARPNVDAIIVLDSPSDDPIRRNGPGHFREPGQADSCLFIGGKVVMAGGRNCSNSASQYPSPERHHPLRGPSSSTRSAKEMPPRVVARFPVNHRRAEPVLIDVPGPVSIRSVRRPPRT